MKGWLAAMCTEYVQFVKPKAFSSAGKGKSDRLRATLRAVTLLGWSWHTLDEVTTAAFHFNWLTKADHSLFVDITPQWVMCNVLSDTCCSCSSDRTRIIEKLIAISMALLSSPEAYTQCPSFWLSMPIAECSTLEHQRSHHSARVNCYSPLVTQSTTTITYRRGRGLNWDLNRCLLSSHELISLNIH